MTTSKKIKGVAHANPIDGHGTLFDVTYVGHADCDSRVPFSYLKKLSRDGYRVHVAASQADGDKPMVLEPCSE